MLESPLRAPVEKRGRSALGRVASAALALLAVLTLGVTPALPGALYLAAVTPRLIRVDLREHRLPNGLVLPGYPAAFVGVLLAALTGRDAAAALLSGAAYLGLVLLLNLVGGMGMGDVKLAGVLGLVLGTISPAAALLGPTIAFLAGGAVAASLLLSRRAARGTRIPFGPFMLLGFWTALLLEIWRPD